MKAFCQQEWMFFKQEYRRIFYFVTLFTILVFAISYGIGLYAHPEETMQHIAERRASAANFVQQPAAERFIQLTSHNMIALIKTVIFGLVPVVVLPLITILNTFANLSLHFVTTYLEGGSLVELALFRFGPHGFVETLSMIMASTLGIHLSLTLLKSRHSLRKKETWMRVLQHTRRYIRSFVVFVVPLVVLAGFLEGIVTPWITASFL